MLLKVPSPCLFGVLVALSVVLLMIVPCPKCLELEADPTLCLFNNIQANNNPHNHDDEEEDDEREHDLLDVNGHIDAGAADTSLADDRSASQTPTPDVEDAVSPSHTTSSVELLGVLHWKWMGSPHPAFFTHIWREKYPPLLQVTMKTRGTARYQATKRRRLRRLQDHRLYCKTNSPLFWSESNLPSTQATA